MGAACDTIIHAGTIITQNSKREILYDYSMAIKDGKIAALEPAISIKRNWCPNTELDYSRHLLMPGLINSHTHTAMTFLRGLGDDLSLMQWLNEHIFPLESKLTPEIVELGTMLGYAEMLSSGTTACIDMYIFENSVFQAAEKTGIRCLGGEAIFEFPSAAFSHYENALEATEMLAEKYSSSDTIKIAVNPHSVYTTTSEILQACHELATRHSLPIHIHLAETANETELSLKRHGMRPIAWCHQNGLFELKVIAAHLVDVLPEEIEFIRNFNIIPVHNPASNMKLGSGISPVCDLLAAGLPVALGTDGPASNNGLNMFSEMKHAALLQKVSTKDPGALCAQSALDMTTINGAVAFNNPLLGSLETGKKADCIVLDTGRPNMFPNINPVSQSVYSATGSECLLTMINGKIIYREGKFYLFDYDILLKELDNIRKFIIENR